MMHQEMRPTLSFGARLRALLLDHDFEPTEAISGIAATGWGLIVLLPVATFGTSHTYDAMASLAPEWAWGLAVLLVGILQLLTLLLDWHSWRRHTAFLAFCAWLFMSVMFIRANAASTATAIYPTMALAAAWAYWRLSLLRRGTP